MSDYSIGLSGLAAAQRAFDVIGNNIANAATEGYHRQRLELSPAFSSHPGSTTFIGGVNVEGATRMIDTLLEQEILRQKSILAAVSQETATLSTIEAAFGEFGSEDSGLSAAIDSFFNSLQDLNANPNESVWQNQLVSDAETLTAQFRSLGEFLETLQTQIKLQTDNIITDINTLAGQIAELNSKIEKTMLVGGEANSICDQRDRLISDLSDLIGIQTVNKDNGVVDVTAGSILMVTGAFANTVEADYNENGELGISIVDAINSETRVQGGTIGGLLSLHNEIVSGLIEDLDLLANAIIQEVNQIHVMGVGNAGSFTQLTAESSPTDQLSDISSITSGTLYMRVTNTTTDQITRQSVTIDADNDTLSDVAAKISAVSGLTASVNSSNQLSISADPGYEFDFLPCALPEPEFVDFDDASPPTISVTGIYTGTENDTLEFKVIGDGAVGNGTLQLEVRSGGGAGNLITTLNIGSGYAAGDLLDIGNGIKIALSTGNLAESNGDLFTVGAFTDTDTSGILAAIGLNTFFSGSSALDMAVRASIIQNPQSIATALGAAATDNNNISRIAAIKDKAIGDLKSSTCGEFYHKLAMDIGQEISTKKRQQENLDAIVLNLANRQNEIGGVDINEEAAQLLVFEQMFQAMAEYMNTLNTSMANLMEIL